MGRRQFLRGMAVTGAVAGAGSLLSACSGGSSSTISQAAQASRSLRRGGDLRLGLTGGSRPQNPHPPKSPTHPDTSPPPAPDPPPAPPNPPAAGGYVPAPSIAPPRSPSTPLLRLP